MASPIHTINKTLVTTGRAVAAGGTLDDTTLIINVFEISERIIVRLKPWGALSEMPALPDPELRLSIASRMTAAATSHL